jgi:riboflavin kinase/FMN adenylyltransferase
MKLTGKIVHGAGRGKGLGFPTINLEGAFSDLEMGVFAAWVSLDGGPRLAGAMHHGVNRTFEEGVAHVEIFLLDFSGEVYGQSAEVDVVKKIRDTQKFSSAEELVAQIQRDVLEVRSVLKLDS